MSAVTAIPSSASNPLKQAHIDAAGSATLRQIACAATACLQASHAVICLVDVGQHTWLASAGELPSNDGRDDLIAAHAIATPDTLIIADASRDQRVSKHPLVNSAPRLRSLAAQSLRAANGTPIGVLWVADTVSRSYDEPARLALRAIARLAETELQRISAADAHRLMLTQQVIGPAVHQMRGALTNIDGFAAWLLETDASEAQRREFLEIIHTQAGYLDDIVTELVQLAQLELSADQDFSWAMQSLTPIVEQAIASCRTRTSHPIALEAQPSLPSTRLNAARLGLALSQLFVGLVRHSGGRETRVALQRDATASALRLLIAAPGIKLVAAQIDALFEPFHRLQQRDSSIPGGIGLALIRKVLALHGGAIHASTDSNGLLISVTIPILT